MKQKADLLLSQRNDDETDKLLTVAEVARTCQVSDRTVLRWCADGKIAYAQLGTGVKKGSVIRIRESALIKFWKQSERKAIP